jgi:hypothetical protein
LDAASQAAEQALTLDIEALRWFIDQTRVQVSDWLSSLSKSESPYLELEYESARSSSRQQRIWEFLGVDASVPVLRPTTRKIMTDDRYRRIANLSEIETELGSDENGTLLSPGDSGE